MEAVYRNTEHCSSSNHRNVPIVTGCKSQADGAQSSAAYSAHFYQGIEMLAQSGSGRNRLLLRSVLFFIILGTLPFYVLAFIVLASAGGNRSSDQATPTQAVTLTPLGAELTATTTATITPTRIGTATQLSPLQPTPFQFIPPTRLPTSTATAISIPTDTPAPTLTPSTDSDGDGVLDHLDNCRLNAGPVSNGGCPVDSDGDGVANPVDACPNQPGSAANNGCPADSDGDSVPDASDNCPNAFGQPLLGGCPDTDGDGVADIADSCPAQAGTLANGCPDADTDGDGVTDSVDSCPAQAGDPANNGCPLDSDGDGLPDSADTCPAEAGPAENGGCPLAPTPAT
jgi:hypothetical protein